MTRLMDMLSPSQKEALKVATAALEARAEPDEVDVTTINGVEYDVRSGAMVETTCADCPEQILVEVAPKGADLDLLCSKPRVAVCTDCGKKRVAGKRGTLVHTKKPQEAPVSNTEIDLTKFSEAELAQLAVEARKHMLADKAEALPEKRKKAKKKEAKRIAEDDALKAGAREKRRSLGVLPAVSVVVKGRAKEIPALDLSDEGLDLNIVPDKDVRSPYNKALYALGKDLLDKETTTYVTLVDLHQSLLAEHGTSTGAVEAPKKAKKGKKGKKVKAKAKAPRLAAQIDPDAKAKVEKVEAFAAVTGKTYEEAAIKLVAAGVI